jgi:hypothetical protein
MALRNFPGQVLSLAICLSGLLPCSCNPEKATETKTLNFGEFTITVPSAWQPVNEKGIDSFVGRIALTDGDTISFDLGWYSNPLEEEVLYKVDETNVYLLNSSESTFDSQMFEFYGKRDTVDLEKFHKNKITWSTIDGRKAKVIEAKLPGDGMTGIYIDSVWRAGSGIDRFQLNGTDLTPANQQALLAAMQTLKFIDRHSLVSLDNNIVGVWMDEWSSKPSFSIDKDSIHYLQTFISAKYSQRGDSVTLTYKDMVTKAKMFRIHKDTLIYEFDGIARKSWRFNN